MSHWAAQWTTEKERLAILAKIDRMRDVSRVDYNPMDIILYQTAMRHYTKRERALGLTLCH